jgi:hypothetical protein
MVRPPIADQLPAEYVPPLRPTHDQIIVLYSTAVFVVVIFAFWHLPGVRIFLNPLKIFTIGIHELSHVVAALLTGGTVLSITIDPNFGGCTPVEAGHAPTILAAGYIGSTFFGGVLIFVSFDILAAKIASFVIGIGLLCPLALVRDKLTILLTFLYEALLIGFWFIDHASPLRWYCLFLGVMSVFFAVWDFVDDRFFRKPNDSDSSQFSILYPKTQPHHWAIAWIIFEILICIGFMLLGIVAFKRTSQQMYEEAAGWLPT